MKNKSLFAIALTTMFTLTGCFDGLFSKCLKHVDKNSDYKCDKCGENLPFIDSDKISKDFTFDASFPEESLKQFLGSESVFKPSSTFTGKGAYYAQNQTDETMTVVYAVDFSDENLELLCEEMSGCEDLFSFNTRYTPCDTFGSKNDIYTVSCSSKNFGSKTYLINTYFKNNVLYQDKKLTTNTSWSSEAKLVIGERLPFFKMGEGYKAEHFDKTASENEYILITDNYAKHDLKNDIVDVLIENGFYYVPLDGTYQKASDAYNVYAYTVRFFYNYGTQVKLTKELCASKTFQKKLVEEAFINSLDFQSEFHYMNLSAKEYLGKEIAPIYKATYEETFVTVTGTFANVNEFIELENKYINDGYKIVNETVTNSLISVELAYLNVTIVLDLKPLSVSIDGSQGVFNDFNYSTLSMTFKFTEFIKFPSLAFSQFFEGQSTVEVPPINGTSYRFLVRDGFALATIYSDDLNASYYEFVENVLNDGWVVDEIDFCKTNGEDSITLYKDNLLIEMGFFYDSQSNTFFIIQASINKNGPFPISSKTWPEEEINAISLGRTDVQLPVIDDPDNMICYAYMQKSNLEYSIYGYGLLYAEDYADLLEADGFTGAYDEDGKCYNYTKGNLSIKVYEGMYHFRIDATINL